MMFNMRVILVATLILAAIATAAPAVKYDQRQEGDVNIRADLENFVILIIPTSPASTGSLGLLDLLSKGIPSRAHIKHNKHIGNKKLPTVTAAEDETVQHFIESKTAPYHVDISRTRSHLAKLHPQVTNGEVLIAHSPTISLAKTLENDKLDDKETEIFRTAKNFNQQSNDDFQALVVSSDLTVGGRKAGRAEKKANKQNTST